MADRLLEPGGRPMSGKTLWDGLEARTDWETIVCGAFPCKPWAVDSRRLPERWAQQQKEELG